MADPNENERLRWLGISQKKDSVASAIYDSDGNPAAGMRVIEEDGTESRDGARTFEAGDVEFFGREFHFTDTGTPADSEAQFTYDNLTVSDTEPEVGDTITISADVTNNGTRTATEYTRFIINGQVFDTAVTKGLSPGQSRTVSFDFYIPIGMTLRVGVEDAGPVTVEPETGSLFGWSPW